jgi:hypothetical protein
MRRALILSICALVALGAAGCGGGSDDGSAPDTPQEQAVQKAYRDYIDALKQGDGEAACALLSPAFQKRAGAAVAVGNRAELRNADCVKAIEKGTLPQIQQVVPNLEDVQVSGNRASAIDPGEGQIGPQQVYFVKIGGDWKLDKTVIAR